jgi:ubiquinone/menaquinone biosynthesis C-methylase UbiE
LQPRDATELIAPARLRALGPATWADLGCGDGTFTRALAEALAAGSSIHAMDREASALKRIPSQHGAVRIQTHRGDFTRLPWPFHSLDGILMANSLHYVKDKAAFIRQCKAEMVPPGRFVVVEYDTAHANQWVPYPIGVRALEEMFRTTGYQSFALLGSRPSVFRRAEIYAVVVS